MSGRKLTKYKMLTVYCKCWQKLVKYKKGGSWRLIKINKERITEDCAWVFINELPENTDVFCPNCWWRLATVKLISWKYMNKLNQWMIWTIKK